MKKFLLFTTGGGSADPTSWDSSKAAIYSVDSLKTIKPRDARTLDLFFEESGKREIVSLGIKSNSHSRVASAISNAIATSSNAVIAVADVDGNSYINNLVHSVTLRPSDFFIQTISDNDQVPVQDADGEFPRYSPSSMVITPTADSTVSLWLTSISGQFTAATGTLANEGDNEATTASVTLTVDGTSATNNVFKDEIVFHKDGTVYGICTAVNSTTEIVFGGGIEQTLENNVNLETGVRSYILKSTVMPTGSTLILDHHDIGYSITDYRLYVQFTAGSGYINIKY